MRLPARIEKLRARFDALSLRERALTACALLAALFVCWTIAILDPISADRSALLAEQAALEEHIAATLADFESGAASDPLELAGTKERQLQASIAAVDAELTSKSAGLIPPERMVRVIRDVLDSQRGIRLVSLHNKPVTSLAAGRPMTVDSQLDMESAARVEPSDSAVPAEQVMTAPFVHPVEIIVEGAYLDVLAYLQALESLEWRFYWVVLELETKRYPVNRVRIELATLSMDQSWIGM